MFSKKSFVFAGFAAGLLAMSGAANAVTVTFTGAQGGTAQADFLFGTNTLTVTLTELNVDPANVAQNLSGFGFSIDGSTGASLVGASATSFRTVAADGTFVDAAGPSTPATVGWTFSNSSGLYLVDDLAGGSAAGPAHTLIGSAGGDNKYQSNSSITGNGPHNPFLAGSLVFNYTFTGGVTSSSLPTSTWFQFGTVRGLECGTNCTPSVPEPTTLALFGLGLLGIGAARRRRS